MSQRPDGRGAADLVSAAPLLSVLALVAVNLLPVAALLAGWMTLGDVFVVYWLENLAVWAVTVVKVATARAPEPADTSLRINGRPASRMSRGVLAGFFSFHYGIFTLVHGFFAFGLAFAADGELHGRTWLLTGLAFLASHVASLGVNWFGEDERARVSPSQAMWQPYPRMLVLHAAIIGGFLLMVRDQIDQPGPLSQTSVLLPVLLLCGLKTLVDLWFHLRERARARTPEPGLPVAGIVDDGQVLHPRGADDD